MKLTIPSKLKKGDRVGIVAPSSGLAGIFKHRSVNAKKMLEEMGFEVVYSKHALEVDGYYSATAEKRADDINKMFADKSVKAIISTIGGYHANQLLKYLDYDLIKKNPKIFLGYSDITVLHYAFAKKAKLRTYYGPCFVSEFGEFPKMLPYTKEYFEKAVINDNPIGSVLASKTWTDEILDWSQKKDLTRPRKQYPNDGYVWWREGKATGEIFGATIPTIHHLVGTEYWIDPKDKIFFFDLPEGHGFGEPISISEVDASFADLDNLGFFDQLKGLIIGRPYRSNKEEAKKLKKLVLKYTKKTNYPILFNANIGHASPIITVPLGAEVSLDSRKNLFIISD